MCGIFGYVGMQKDVSSMILEGLKTLEYRGYDSWGIAIKKGQKIQIEKHTGRIVDPKTNFPRSTIGMGHTRWATHGGITVENAHPLLDCSGRIAVLHNGIIENYYELKEDLLKKGHKFVSETDTETMAHLVEENLRKMSFTDSVRDAFKKIKGLNAIVILNASTNEIIAVKNGSPLVIGKSPEGFFLSSDPLGIVKHTKELLFMKDNTMVVLGNVITVLDIEKNTKIEPVFEKITWEIEKSSMGSFEHFMLKEIYDQPKVVNSIATRRQEIDNLSELIKKAKGTFFIGAGTAYYACLAGVYLFSKVAKKHINTSQASEFNYLEDFLTPNSLIVAFSQSGETIDVIEPIQRAIRKGSRTVAVTNVLGSTLYRISQYKMLLSAGSEKAVASTKAYIAKLAVLLMLSYSAAGKTRTASKLLLDGAAEIDRILSKNNTIKKLSEDLFNSENIYLIGRGLSYPSALEGALKIKEVSYIHSEGFSGGELKHGPIALISKKTPVIVFAPNDETYDAIISNAMEVKARGGLIIGISFKKNPVFDHFIEVKDLKEASSIVQIVPVQLLAYYLALSKGYDPDKPRNLAKSVTVR